MHGFEPYFYISCPPGMGPDDISRFHQALEVLYTKYTIFVSYMVLCSTSYWFFLVFNLQGRMKDSNRNSNVPRFVKRVELVQKKSIMYYQPQTLQPFLKIVVALPTMVASCRGKCRYERQWKVQIGL